MEEKRYWIHLNQVKGALAMWAVRQTPYVVPENLAVVISQFVLALGSRGHFKDEMGHFSRGELRDLFALLHTIPEFLAWNERKNGNQSPYQFVSRYDGPRDPDDDFIDLGALTRNCEMEIWRECERDAGFDERIEKENIWWRRWLRAIRFKLSRNVGGVAMPCDPEPAKPTWP